MASTSRWPELRPTPADAILAPCRCGPSWSRAVAGRVSARPSSSHVSAAQRCSTGRSRPRVKRAAGRSSCCRPPPRGQRPTGSSSQTAAPRALTRCGPVSTEFPTTPRSSSCTMRRARLHRARCSRQSSPRSAPGPMPRSRRWPIVDTVKRIDGNRVVDTVPRDDLVVVQTPQAFRADALRAAHAGDAVGHRRRRAGRGRRRDRRRGSGRDAEPQAHRRRGSRARAGIARHGERSDEGALGGGYPAE